ncbi:MAG TPA: hypothetical protein VM074_07825 [Solimonas sp.]|nr:hypothetical protein [Solimonas sp.]
MNSAEHSRRVATLLDAVPSLHEVFDAEPQVVVIPTAPGAPDPWTLFVGLFLKDHALTVEGLRSACSRIITELKEANALPNGTGVEIMCCASRGVTSERVLRLQVQHKAVPAAEYLTADDLRKSEPGEGIKCALYVRALIKAPADGL